MVSMATWHPEFPASWHRPSSHPLCDGAFLRLLETSGAVGRGTGWAPYHLEHRGELLPGHLKAHSYGEFIFDHAWANFYHQHGVRYYPKLLHALPFTPVNAPKVLGAAPEELLGMSFENYQREAQLSGEHYLFTTAEEARLLERLGFATMETLQFHWHNRYESFEHYLTLLSKNRRKMIKRERQQVAQSELVIRQIEASELTPETMGRVYQLYLSTIDKKDSQAYLPEAFFHQLPNAMNDKLLIVAAFKESELIAMALFFTSPAALYGRYWGILPQHQESYPFLHFELCYYQGMDHCLAQRIPLFEAGAQGEHKLWRGFEPVKIRSAHHLRHREFFPLVRDYIREHNRQNELALAHYRTFLPF